jgi:hypothetical protein
MYEERHPEVDKIIFTFHAIMSWLVVGRGAMVSFLQITILFLKPKLLDPHPRRLPSLKRDTRVLVLLSSF